MPEIDIYDHDTPPERTEEMENHQVWVWLNGATPPHWEIKGTGVIFNASN